MNALRPVAGLLIVLVLATGSAAQAPKSGDAIRAYVESCERFGFSGSVLVVKGGKELFAGGAGFADRDKQVRNTRDTLFEIASATKPFTAVAIFLLASDGKLTTDDPIGKHLPGVPGGFEDVTIQHLLTHTSGMPRSATGGSGDDLEAAVRRYLAKPRVKKAGAVHEYWNGGYALLGAIVERVSGMTYMQFCRRRIFEPAGMTSSGFTGDSELDAARIAIGHEGGDAAPRRADEHPYRSYGWQYRGMGGLVTSVDDLYRFAQALRNETLLKAAARKKLFDPFLADYACGFHVVAQPRSRIGHGGDVRGFHCQFWMYPNDDGCIIVLANVGGIPTSAIEENLRHLAFGDRSRSPRPPVTERWTKDALEALAGAYEAPSGERIVVHTTPDTISLRAEGVEIQRQLTAPPAGPPSKVDAALVDVAVKIVRAVAEGNVEPLRQQMAPGIPPGWPDTVKSDSWPKRVAGLGALKAVRVAGALGGEATSVLIATDFAQGRVHVKVRFAGDRVQIFDLQGPEFLAEALVQPTADGRLARFAWQGQQPAAIRIVRNPSGRPQALELEGGAAYRRVPD